MARIEQFVLCVLGILAICTHCDGRDWRGIVPLHSTKKDVVRSLGLPADTNEIRSIYHLENEDVYIVFSGNKTCNFKATRIPTGIELIKIGSNQIYAIGNDGTFLKFELQICSASSKVAKVHYR